MKKLLIVLLAFSLLSPNNLQAQKRTYLGWEGGVKWDFFSMDDPGGSLNDALLPTFISGFTIGQEIHQNLFVETGFTKYQYYESIMFKNMTSPASVSGMVLYQIPLRIKYSIPLIKNHLFVTPTLGVIGAFNKSYQQSGPGGIRFRTETSFTSVDIVSNNNYAKYLVLAEAGIGVSYRFKNNMEYTLRTSYIHGFKTASSSDWTYQIDDAPIQMATRSIKGSNVNIQAGLQFPLSNFWGDQGYIQSIKKQLAATEPLTDTRKFYISAKVGKAGQVNHENASNMIRIPTNLHNTTFAEINFGYQFYKNWIIEGGFNNHQLSFGYSIWDPLNMSFSSSAFGGTDLIGIPLRLKYEVAAAEKVSFSPYIGITNVVSLKKGQDGVKSTHGFNEDEDPQVYTEISRFIEKNYGLLLSTGITFEYRLFPKFSIIANGEYNYGLINLSRLHVEHNIDNETYTADIFNRGSGFKFSVGGKYSIW